MNLHTDPPGGGGFRALALASSAEPPPPPQPPPSETFFLRRKMKCIKGARNGRLMLGTQTCFWPRSPFPPVAAKQWPGPQTLSRDTQSELPLLPGALGWANTNVLSSSTWMDTPVAVRSHMGTRRPGNKCSGVGGGRGLCIAEHRSQRKHLLHSVCRGTGIA